MRPVRKLKVRSRLASLAFKGGGITVNAALKQADLALEPLRAPGLIVLDAAIAEIERRYGREASGRAGEPFEDLYLLCSRVIDLALFVPDSGLDEAARAFCGLADLSQELKTWAWDAVEIHIEALKLLRMSGAAMSQAERDAILEGLAQVTQKRLGDLDDVRPDLAGARATDGQSPPDGPF
jgi:hypothetical protein